MRLAAIEKQKQTDEAKRKRIEAEKETVRLAAIEKQKQADEVKRKRIEAEKEKVRLAAVEKKKQVDEAKGKRIAAEKKVVRLAELEKKNKTVKAEEERMAAEREVAKLAGIEKKKQAAEAERKRIAAKLATIDPRNAANTDKGSTEVRASSQVKSNAKAAAERRLARLAAAKKAAEDDNKEIEGEKELADVSSTAQTAEKELAPSEQKWRSFFFPINDLKTAQAYQYIASGSSPDTTYKLMRTLDLGGKSFLITEEYNRHFQLKYIKKEQVNGNGVFVKTFTSYETNGLGETSLVVCGVIKDDYINWAMNQGDKSTVQYNYNSSLFPNYDITVKKKIEMLQDDVKIEHEGKQLNAIMIKDAEVTVFTNHKKVSEERYKLEYINQYAEGVGLVQYAIQMVNHPTEVPRTYKLAKVMPYTEWDNMARFRGPRSN